MQHAVHTCMHAIWPGCSKSNACSALKNSFHFPVFRFEVDDVKIKKLNVSRFLFSL